LDHPSGVSSAPMDAIVDVIDAISRGPRRRT
jgi:hypothetical protein